jgi:hypothetical protein
MHAIVLMVALAAQPGIATLYVDGLLAAEKAYKEGGSDESLVPVRTAITALEQISGNAPGPAEIARLVLMAAVAAAQSERDEMGAFLTHAVEMEVLQRAAGQPGAPVVSALEAAGDLWLRVHRYDDAKLAYERAAALLGMTPRIKAGLARIPVR